MSANDNQLLQSVKFFGIIKQVLINLILPAAQESASIFKGDKPLKMEGWENISPSQP
jgi:hypothetical protein